LPCPTRANESKPLQPKNILLNGFGELGGLYAVEYSDELQNWHAFAPPFPGRNARIRIQDNHAGPSRFYRLAYMPPQPILLPGLKTFCAVGDSITDRSTSPLPEIYQGLGYDFSGWGAVLELLSYGRLRSVARSNAFRNDRDHGYSGITTWMYLGGGGWLPAGLVPVEDALRSGADCYIVHIGTNDIASAEASVVTARIRSLWARLRQSGKPVIGTDILQRAASYPGWTTQFRDRLNEVNRSLRATWKADGLAGYRQWDDLIEKDSQGFALGAEFPNDGVHPSMRVGLKLGKDLHRVLEPFYRDSPHEIPHLTSPRWLTPNPGMSGTGALANSWISFSLGTPGKDVEFSKTNDSNGTWQRIRIINTQSPGDRGLYARQVGADQTWTAGDRCVATATIRVPEGTGFSGISLHVRCFGSSSSWANVAGVSNTYQESQIEDFQMTIVSQPFTIPPGTTELWLILRIIGGPGTVEFTRAGVLRQAP
jgi:hypothetical protein